ncbi:hypothetical protein ACHAXS_006655 [Conticribra weissflogii]
MNVERHQNVKHYHRNMLVCSYFPQLAGGIILTGRQRGMQFVWLSGHKHVDVVPSLSLSSLLVAAIMMFAYVPATDAYCVSSTTVMHCRRGLSVSPLFRFGYRRTNPPKSTLYSAVEDSLEVVQKTAIRGTVEVENAVNDSAINNISNEAHLDNLLPSTMNLRIDGVGPTAAGRRKMIGVSSSALIPSNETEFSPGRSNTVYNGKIQSENERPESWKDRLMDVSNIASFLCVLDCTLLPLVSVAIPALSWMVGSITSLVGASLGTTTTTNSVLLALSSVMAAIPAIGHAIALYFVIPVGILTTVVNYVFGHKELRFSLPALLGIMLIYTANSNGIGISSVDSWLASVGIIAQTHAHHAHGVCSSVLGHSCTLGWTHRLTNTLGCAFLLGSNYLSRKFMEENRQGCAASAMAKALGGEGTLAVCPPGCGCENPVRYGAGGYGVAEIEGETFFQWGQKENT